MMLTFIEMVAMSVLYVGVMMFAGVIIIGTGFALIEAVVRIGRWLESLPKPPKKRDSHV